MSKLIHAYTALNPVYPGYVNFTREDDGSVAVYVRGDPRTVEGRYVCGYARDKGQPGRCTPGDDRCNNYCNLAPDKGPMPSSPAPCEQVLCGETVKFTMSAEAYEALKAALAAEA